MIRFWISILGFALRSRASAKVSYITLCAVLFALCLPVAAQPPKNIPRIGFLSRDTHPSGSSVLRARRVEVFRQGLRELGLELYSGAHHGFTTPDTPANERANVRAWAATQKFFAEVFKN